MVTHFPEDPLAKTARNRLNALTQEPSQQKEPEALEEVVEEDDQDAGRKSEKPKDPKESENEK